MYYKAPHKILWAFYIRHHSFRARIDDIEHNISGYCSYYHQILEASDKPLNSTVEPDRTTTLPDNGLINAKTYLRIPTPYGRHSGWSGADNQATHPSIVQFERPWNGYKYWMAFTPYPFAYLSTENPCIAASNDGIKWEVPPGITNPIISEPNLPNSYNSDTHLFFNDMTSMLELWYREISNKEVETLFRVTSPDGSSWTEPESMMAIASKDLYKAISPSILFENGLYKMWVMRDWIIHYAESSDGQSWGEFSPVTSNGNTIHSWHPNVIKLGSIYYLLNCDKNTNKGSGGVIKYAISDDGIHFSEETQLLTYTGNEKDINGYGVCRPSIVIEEHKVMVYYSTFSHNDEWRISVTVGQNLDRLIGIDEQVLDAYNDL